MLISSRIICQILGCLFVLSLFLYSQSTDIAFERISEAQGLSRGTVYCLLQDRQGFMWFGTGGGLNRYDGYDFTVFLHDPSDPASLSHNWIVSLCEGDTGTLWVGTLGGGLNRFDHATERFTRYLADDADTTRLPDNRITALLRDRSG
ncbi:MAG: hypothetical protein KDI01_12125, partial [Halioglobus sp.]|nr:hypothetical protein [Halioglobus sp.]